MDNYQKVSGVGWGAAALSTGLWTGVKLADVLNHVQALDSKDYHVEFLSSDYSEESKDFYGTSIPLSHALDPRNDVLLCYKLNDKTLTRDNGYPLRVLIPGMIGAWSVKWLSSIEVRIGESPNFYTKRDYKLFLPHIKSKAEAEPHWDKSMPILALNVNSAICNVVNGMEVDPGAFTVKGYAYSSLPIQRVDISLDEGNTWLAADLFHPGLRYDNSRIWTWTLWRFEIPEGI